MARENLCPFCGIHGVNLFSGLFFKEEAINAVSPIEVRELAREVLVCGRESCMNYGIPGLTKLFVTGSLEGLYCPVCSVWNLQLDYSAQRSEERRVGKEC